MLSMQGPSKLPHVQHASSECATQSRDKSSNLNLIYPLPSGLIWLLNPHILKEKTAALSPVSCMYLEIEVLFALAQQTPYGDSQAYLPE